MQQPQRQRYEANGGQAAHPGCFWPSLNASSVWAAAEVASNANSSHAARFLVAGIAVPLPKGHWWGRATRVRNR